MSGRAVPPSVAGVRPPTSAWTSRVLLAGSLISAVSFAVGFVLGSLGAGEAGAIVSNVGVISMLATPVFGLLVTAAELRLVQRQATIVAIGVLAVLAVAVGVAYLAR